MKKILLICLLFSSAVSADIYTSSTHKVSLLELYTSEGCSSCPPAEAWLSRVYRQGFRDGAVVPLAFHVTYWDYLGWKDRFSNKSHDQRQRKMVTQEGGRTVYTPQFFLNAKTIRSVSAIKTQLDSLSMQRADVKIWSDVTQSAYDVVVEVRLERVSKHIDDILHVLVVPYENNIKSSIEAGENEGRDSIHQYLARDLQSSLMSLKGSKKRQFYFKKKASVNLSGVVVFVESNNEVIQALNIPLKKS